MNFHHGFARGLASTVVFGILAGVLVAAQKPVVRYSKPEANRVLRPETGSVTAIVGGLLIDGRGGPPLEDSIVIVRGTHIVAVGPRSRMEVPPGASMVDARGKSVLPGFIDSHFHLDRDESLPAIYVTHGVTSVRDPGAWVEAYDIPIRGPAHIPRLFLTGPHLDMPPPAYPADSLLVRDSEEARLAVERLDAKGANAIKVYFRLSLGLIRVVTAAAHARGLPVTAHLETVDARDAIEAGVDGIEHVTSFGSALLPPREAEAYHQSIIADNRARVEGRYKIWAGLDLQAERVRRLIDLLVRRRTFLSVTLAVFEKRAGDPGATDLHVQAFKQMVSFVGMARRAGGRIVVGSHSAVPHAERGWAYQRELELLVESGMTEMQAIVAGTSENARFLRIEDRLGTVESGKLADLLLLESNPLKDIRSTRKIFRVMLNGCWVTPVEGSASGQGPE